VRLLLPAYDGCECKEPKAAKFTLAFRCGSSNPNAQIQPPSPQSQCGLLTVCATQWGLTSFSWQSVMEMC
jgi:hypothetical protein